MTAASPNPLQSLDPDSFLSCVASWKPSRQQALERVHQQWPNPAILDLIAVLPATVMLRAGMTPDSWQHRLLSFLHKDRFRLLVNVSRQLGKTTAAAALALATGLLFPKSDIVVIARTQRQASEFVRRVKDFRISLQYPVRSTPWAPRPASELDPQILADLHAEEQWAGHAIRDAVTMEELSNRSRIIALPGKSVGAVMGFSAKLLIVDEASWFPDSSYVDLPGFLIRTGGSMLCLSYGGFRNGSWWDRAWHQQTYWQRVRQTIVGCPHIPADVLAQERQRLSPMDYARNYECAFTSEAGAYFDPRDVERMFV